MSSRNRVVITGMGAVTPIGVGVSRFWERCVAGTSGVDLVRRFVIPEGFSQIAGMASEVPFSNAVERSVQFALLAAREAVGMSGLGAEAMQRCGVYISTAIAQISSMERQFAAQSHGGAQQIAPLRGPRLGGGEAFSFNATAEALEVEFHCGVGSTTIPTGCTGGLDALGYAVESLRSGQACVAISGATEAPITPLVVAAFGKIGATSMRNSSPQTASRPFERDRDGFVLGEGAALFVLETLEHATTRGATILAEISGYGSVNNCYHMTDIPEDGQSIARSIQVALRDAALSTENIDAINVHGSSTQQNDIAETRAYYSVFGPRAEEIPVTSIKSQIGHPLAASNSIEVVSVIQSLRTGIIPPTINYVNGDPHCRLNVVANVARTCSSLQSILKTSSGFSGIHSAMILKKWSE